MAEMKIQDVFRKVRERQEVLTEAETAMLFAHLDSLSERISGLERMRAELASNLEDVSQPSNTRHARKQSSSAHRTSKPGKKELLQEYGLLYEALQHTRPTNIEDGEEHQIYLNRLAILAGCAAELYAQGVEINAPLRLREDEEDQQEENKEDQKAAIKVWGKVAQQSLLTNETLVILTANDLTEQAAAKASMGAVFASMKTGELGNIPLPQTIIEIEGIVPWSEKPSRTFFHLLIESMGMRSIREALEQAIKEHQYVSIFSRIAGSDFIGQILTCMYTPSSDRHHLPLLDAYLGEGCSQRELRELGLPRNLTSEDRYLLLSTIIQFRLGSRCTEDLQEHARVWLWLDRLENILHYTPKELSEFTNGLLTIISNTPIMLTLCCNIADTDYTIQTKVLQMLGPRLLEYVDYNLVRNGEYTEK